MKRIMHQNQVKFILGIDLIPENQFILIYLINRINEKNHVIISRDAEKAFENTKTLS